MKLRQFVFWPHLIAAVSAGLVILTMSVTGVLLTYERQLIAWADSGYRSRPPSAEAVPLPIDDLLTRLRHQHPDVTPASIALKADTRAAVTVIDGQRTLYVDRYSGALLAEASRGGVRAFMAEMRAWHRWLGADGDRRPIARAITGWSNAVFLFVVVSGIYLWFPRKWSWRQVRNVVLFNRAARSKARDFNWHNVIGSWCAVPLFVVVLCAMPISFGWFNALVYRAVGETPPTPAAGRGNANRPPDGGSRRATVVSTPTRVDLERLFTRAAAHVPEWRTISLRLPVTGAAPAVITIDTGDGGQPHRRSTLSLQPATGDIVRSETFADLTLGRRIRNIMRFAHTGEVLGVAGQTVAGIASAGAVMLAWTGFALTWRRFRSWVDRRSRRAERPATRTAA